MSKEIKEKKLTSTKKLLLLITVIKKNKADYYLDLIESYGVNFQMSTFGNGTTKSAIFSDEVGSKSIIFSVISEDKEKKILNILKQKFSEIRDGKGVAWTIPFSSVMGVTFFNFLSNNVGSVI